MALKNITGAIEYELRSMLEELKRKDNWIYFVSFFAIVFALMKNWVMLIACLLVMWVLQMKRDYDSGRVLGYLRDKEKKNKPEIKLEPPPEPSNKLDDMSQEGLEPSTAAV